MYQGNYCPKVPSTPSDQNVSPNMMQNFDKCRSYAEVVKSFDKCGVNRVMHDHVYSHNTSDHENVYEIHTTNHVDHATHILHQLKILMSRNLKKFNQLHISKLIFSMNMIIIKTKLSL